MSGTKKPLPSMTDEEIDRLAEALANRLVPLLNASHPRPASAEPLPHKLTVAQFAWCIQRSAYYVNQQTRINPKLRQYVQGKAPKLIHPAALALFGVDSGFASIRLRLLDSPGGSRGVHP